MKTGSEPFTARAGGNEHSSDMTVNLPAIRKASVSVAAPQIFTGIPPR